MHIYDGDVAETPKGGAFITNELSDKLPTSITGVLHNRENGQTDFLRGNKVWRYDEIEKQLMKGFPKRTNPSVFPRLPKKPNGAFFDKHSTYLRQTVYLNVKLLIISKYLRDFTLITLESKLFPSVT